MEAKQTVLVFGASGNMGSAISKSIAKGSYRLLLMSNDAEKLQKFQSDKDLAEGVANPIKKDLTGLVTQPDTSAAEELQKSLPKSKVVKAFNITLPIRLGAKQIIIYDFF